MSKLLQVKNRLRTLRSCWNNPTQPQQLRRSCHHTLGGKTHHANIFKVLLVLLMCKSQPISNDPKFGRGMTARVVVARFMPHVTERTYFEVVVGHQVA